MTGWAMQVAEEMELGSLTLARKRATVLWRSYQMRCAKQCTRRTKLLMVSACQSHAMLSQGERASS